MIFRLKAQIKIKYSFFISSLLLAICLCFPRVGGDIGNINGIYESIVILIIFPLIVIIGSGRVENNKIIIKFCNFFGELSYPLYITHYPLVYCNNSWNYSHTKDKLFNKIGISVATSMIIF